MMMRIAIAAVGAVVLAGGLAGCNKGGGTYTPKAAKKTEIQPVKPEDSGALFPVKPGNKWTYSVESSQNLNGQITEKKDELTLTVVDVREENGAQIFTIQVALNGENTDKQMWRKTAAGIFQETVKSTNGRFTPPQTNVSFPVKDGGTFTWKGTGPTPMGGMSPQTLKGKILGTQLVDTDMGQFSALAIETMTDFTIPNGKGQSKVNSYWVKDVGLVRYKQESVAVANNNSSVRGIQVLRLKMHSLK